jgi:hypothetical protein
MFMVSFSIPLPVKLEEILFFVVYTFPAVPCRVDKKWVSQIHRFRGFGLSTVRGFCVIAGIEESITNLVNKGKVFLLSPDFKSDSLLF